MTLPALPFPDRSFLSLRTLGRADWNRLLEDAEVLRGPRGREPLLKGKRFGMVFYNSSLRTRTSFEVASFDLGAHAVYLQVGGGLWQLEHRDGVVMDGMKTSGGAELRSASMVAKSSIG